MTDKYTAWRATQQQMAAKLNGPGYELPGIQTDFPTHVVIEDVPYDGERRQRCINAGFLANNDFDADIFARLKPAFERRWSEYLAGAWNVDGRGNR